MHALSITTNSNTFNLLCKLHAPCSDFDDILNGVVLEQHFECHTGSTVGGSRLHGKDCLGAAVLDRGPVSAVIAKDVGEQKSKELVEELVGGREGEENIDGEGVVSFVCAFVPVWRQVFVGEEGNEIHLVLAIDLLRGVHAVNDLKPLHPAAGRRREGGEGVGRGWGGSGEGVEEWRGSGEVEVWRGGGCERSENNTEHMYSHIMY